MLLRVACICILCGILVAGLWPFHAPHNNVHWLDGGSVLKIAKYGSIVSAGEFASPGGEADNPCSLEIWLAAGRASASGSILAFYRPDAHKSPFALRQSRSVLSIESLFKGQRQNGSRTKVYVDNFFSHPKLVLITLSSNLAGTSVYADGAFVKTLPNFRFSPQDLTGRLILGNSPSSTYEWSGELKGLAIYERSMEPAEITEHYREWISGNAPKPSTGAIALYRFDEGGGNRIHNQVNAATDLTIPPRFFILDEQFLERPWKEFRNDWHYWKDVAVNIAGFVPLGLLFFAYFSTVGKVRNPLVLAIFFGFSISLIIEVGQAFLPTRNSGMTDLITNTLGTAVGALLFRLDSVRDMLEALAMLRHDVTVSNKARSPLCEMVSVGSSNSVR